VNPDDRHPCPIAAGRGPLPLPGRPHKTVYRAPPKAVAISFWILAPYIAIGWVRDLITQHHADSTLLGIGLTISSIVLMPALGIAKQRLGVRLGSGATTGEGTQNLLCAYLAAAVLRD